MAYDPSELAALAATDLACYCVALCPGFQLAPHVKIILDRLEAAERGQIHRLLVFVPPRHGKSLLGSQFFPAWFLGRHPNRSVITTSYGEELATDFGRRVRNLLAEPLHGAIFPHCRLAEDSFAVHRFSTTRGGNYYAVGRGGPITGRGADLLVIDDPLKDHDEAQSESIRRGLHEWYAHVAYTRLQPGGAIVLIQTRWHEDDLAGWLLREHGEENWVVVSLPAIAEVDESFRRAGEALWPEKFPLQQLERIRQSVGSAAWASLYQQRPAAAEGAIFKRGWIRTYREPPSSFQRIIQSWDTAFKTGAENDFSVVTTWGSTEAGHYLLSLWRGRVEFPELKRQLANQAEQWRPHAILVEDRASGQSLIQELRLATRFPILPIKVDSDKRARAEAVTPLFEAGKILLPESAPWLDTYLDELAVFPAGVHDDQVDSTTQALNYLREQSNCLGLVEYLQQEAARQLAGTAKLTTPDTPCCPQCGATTCIVRVAGQWRCNHCGNQWPKVNVFRGLSRADLFR